MVDNVERSIKAMLDSVYLINEIIAADKHDEQLDDDVRRNYKHLEIMMGKDWIIESGEDLTPFVDCVVRAKTWLGE
jgi:hypothetical protein